MINVSRKPSQPEMVLCWGTLNGLTGGSLSLIQYIDLLLSPIEDAVAAFRNLKLRLLHAVHFILIRFQIVKCLDKSYSHPLKKIMSHNMSPFCSIWELKRPHFGHWEWGKTEVQVSLKCISNTHQHHTVHQLRWNANYNSIKRQNTC